MKRSMEIINETSSKKIKKMGEFDEPLLKENKQRHVLFPIQYNDIWQMYKKSLGLWKNYE